MLESKHEEYHARLPDSRLSKWRAAVTSSRQRESEVPMTTLLDKTLRRQISVKGQDYIIALSPEGLKMTLKGKRKGIELTWNALVSGDAALAVALNASVGQFAAQSAAKESPPDKGETTGHPRRNSRS